MRFAGVILAGAAEPKSISTGEKSFVSSTLCGFMSLAGIVLFAMDDFEEPAQRWGNLCAKGGDNLCNSLTAWKFMIELLQLESVPLRKRLEVWCFTQVYLGVPCLRYT